jgi:hypothetical protein
MAKNRERERRWAVISADGSHGWVGRHTDPSEEELARVTQNLSRADVPGWLAVTEGVYYSRSELSVLLVRPLWGDGDWDAAMAAFHERRRRALGPRG